MTDDQRKRAIEDLTSGFEAEGDGEVRTLAEMIEELGFTDAEILAELQRGENPFAKKKAGEEKPKSGEKAPPGHDAKKCEKCTVDAKTGKCPKCGATPKKTSGGDGKKPPFGEKKSEDGNSEAPAVGSDDGEPRAKDPSDAAQAGTSTGMTKNARERAMRLLDI